MKQLGHDGNGVATTTPASGLAYVDLGGAATDIAAGRYHGCAVLDTGAVRCWGWANPGNTGYPYHPTGFIASPAEAGDVQVGATVSQVTAGQWHTCVRTTGGKVRCWGHGAQLGYANNGAYVGASTHPSEAGDVPVL